jgi:Rps23 Pro-64 3,4-dihydroxylase Tpa1-like proline 4-hydroxylase
MIKEEIAPGIVVYSDVMPEYKELPGDIEEVIDSGFTTWYSAGIDSGENKKVRDTDSISIPYFSEFDDEYPTPHSFFYKGISKIFFNAFNQAEQDYKSEYGINYSDHSPYDILKYGKGQKFTNHIDDHQDYHRRISLVYYFNDDYAGGEILFPRFNIKFKPKANQLILFPSTYSYNHSVSEVTEGTRYAVVSWIK